MARQVAPKLLGVLKTKNTGRNYWTTYVYDVDGRIIRHEAKKTPVVRKTGTLEGQLEQMVLVDADGNAA